MVQCMGKKIIQKLLITYKDYDFLNKAQRSVFKEIDSYCSLGHDQFMIYNYILTSLKVCLPSLRSPELT